jgi:hypothetical protein
MKNILIIVGCILLLFTACKKSTNTAPANTISANIDGVDESFNTNVFAQLGTGAKFNSSLNIYGASGSNAGAHVLTITMAVNQTIATGSYTSGSNSIGFVSILYSNGPFSIANPNTYSTDVNGSPSTVVITSLTSTNVQGTFSGILIYGSTRKTITNGKFNLSIK